MENPGADNAVTTPAAGTTPESQFEASEPNAYKVKLEAFEGPLDLLLYLIKKEEINIYDIPIARITEQYLEYLRLMEELDIAVVGEFLVMAATLIHIKSKMLLPPEPGAQPDDLEDPRQELVERLLEHQKFKNAAAMLYQRAEVEQAVFARAPLPSDKQAPEVSATVFDLLEIFKKVLERQKEQAEMEIARDEITMAEKLAEIHELLKQHESFSVRALFERARSKRELIMTFLAVLELVKECYLRVVQSETFGDITALKRVDSPEEVAADQAISDEPTADATRVAAAAEIPHSEE